MSRNRIRYLAKNALGGFDTLDIETAAELARADLGDILKIVERHGHWSDCALNSGPAKFPHKCDCGVGPATGFRAWVDVMRARWIWFVENRQWAWWA